MDGQPTLFDETDPQAEDEAWAVGVRAADEGRVVSHDAVARWLLSWGTEHELPRPRCGA